MWNYINAILIKPIYLMVWFKLMCKKRIVSFHVNDKLFEIEYDFSHLQLSFVKDDWATARTHIKGFEKKPKVMVTSALVSKLSIRQIKSLIFHEIAHHFIPDKYNDFIGDAEDELEFCRNVELQADRLGVVLGGESNELLEGLYNSYDDISFVNKDSCQSSHPNLVERAIYLNVRMPKDIILRAYGRDY